MARTPPDGKSTDLDHVAGREENILNNTRRVQYLEGVIDLLQRLKSPCGYPASLVHQKATGRTLPTHCMLGEKGRQFTGTHCFGPPSFAGLRRGTSSGHHRA